MSTINIIEKQVERVQLAVSSGAITKEELARRAGLRGSTLTTMLDAGWNPTRNTLSRIVDVLDEIDSVAEAERRAAKRSKKSR